MNIQIPQYDEETRNSADFQLYEKNLKFQYSNNAYMKSIDDTLKSINSKLSDIIFILLLPIILGILAIIISVLAGVGTFSFLSNLI